MSRKKQPKKLIGSTDKIDLPEFGLENIACKIDTGAYTSTMHCSNVYLLEKNEQTYLCFRLYDPKFGITTRKQYRFLDFKEKAVRSSNGITDYRYSIRTVIIVFGKKYKTEFTLSYREKMRFPILLGKKFLKKRFIVDVALDNVSYDAKSK